MHFNNPITRIELLVDKQEDVLKKILFVSLILLVAAVSGFSSDLDKIPLVDIPEAENEIAESQATVDAMKTADQQMVAENDQLIEEVKALEKKLVEMKPLLIGIRDKGEELLMISRKISDESASEQTRLAILKNDDLVRRMRETKSEINRAVFLKNKKITSNKKKIFDNEAAIERFMDRITFLNAAVVKSKALKEELNTYMSDMDTYLEQAEGYLEGIKDPKSVETTSSTPATP